MSARPLIGVICCVRLVDGDQLQTASERYIRAASHYADADIILIPALPDLQSPRGSLSRVDAVLLTGSPSNVETSCYGAADPGAAGPFDPARDSTALALVEAAMSMRRPLFGICRGFQEINVALGGSLRRDLGEGVTGLAHHAPADASFNDMFGHEHAVKLAANGFLKTAFGQDELRVNSVHYQGVDRLAPGLKAEATATDGVVEAVSAADGTPLLAVQWHPEWRTADDPASMAYFRLLGAAARGASLEEAAVIAAQRPRD